LKIKLVRADCDKSIVGILQPLRITFLRTAWQLFLDLTGKQHCNKI